MIIDCFVYISIVLRFIEKIEINKIGNFSNNTSTLKVKFRLSNADSISNNIEIYLRKTALKRITAKILSVLQ